MRREMAKHEVLAADATDRLNNQIDEAQEDVAGNAFGLLCFKIAESSLANAVPRAGEPYRAAMFFAPPPPALDYPQFLEAVGKSGMERLNAVESALAAGAPDRADTLVHKLREPGTWGRIVKGFAISAAVAAGKDSIKNLVGYTDDRAR